MNPQQDESTPAPDTVAEHEHGSAEARLSAEVEHLRAELEQTRADIMRERADLENQRKRVSRDLEQLR